MVNYQRINNITGWVAFLISTLVFVLTLEPTASFWDCGEFIACSYKLLVPHPPGAPMFLLLGRIFSLFAMGDVLKVSVLVNLLSALSSSFTVLFLFWSITILARKMVIKEGEEITIGKTFMIMSAGLIGALAYTFTDSFWFNATEAEVYAMSSFFTALVFWAMLKWEEKANESTSDKWLILIAYMMGLSIGVHLLNLLTIPALALIFYHKKFKPSMAGFAAAMAISGAILILILWGIIPGLPSLAGGFEVFFVNSLGLPFGSGIIVFIVLFIALIFAGLRYSIKNNLRWVNTGILSFIFILVGYSSYMIIPIRSGYDPTIDENDPENIMSVVAYLKREQYGDRPLLYGPQFTAEVIAQEEGEPRYIKGKDRYEIVDHKIEQKYDPKHMSLLPRIYSNQPQHIEEYKKWVDIKEGKKPTMGQNLSFLFRYQFGHMYWRYFLWNFVGRDGDIQQSGVLWPFESSKGLPDRVKDSKARNNFYAIPLILGIIGLIFHVKKREKDAFVIGFLFILTGIAIALYLNQPPIEPRERDYTFAGSFYAFAIWIGIGVIGVAELLRKVLANEIARTAVATLLCLSVPAILAAEGWNDHDRSGRYHSVDSAKNLLSSCAPNAILFTNGDNDTFPLWYAQEVEGFRTDVRVAVLSYLNTDWYVDQMKRQAYLSDPLPISLDIENYRQGTNDYLPYVEKPQVKAGMDIKQFMRLVKENHPAIQVPYSESKTFLSFPTKNFYLDVDKNKVLASGIVPKGREDQILDRIEFSINRNAIEKKNLVILDILANNDWKRPVYFSTTVNTSDFMNLHPYFQLEGLAYRILPVLNTTPGQTGYVEKDLMYDNMMKKFAWRNLDNPKIFYDENYLRFPANARDKFYRLATAYINSGEIDKAREVLDHCFKVMPDKAIPYDYYSPQFIEPLVKVGRPDQAKQMVKVMSERTITALDYWFKEGPLFDMEIQTNLFTLQQLVNAAEQIGMNKEANELAGAFRNYYSRLR